MVPSKSTINECSIHFMYPSTATWLVIVRTGTTPGVAFLRQVHTDSDAHFQLHDAHVWECAKMNEQ